MTSDITVALISALGGVLAATAPLLVSEWLLKKKRYATDAKSPGEMWKGHALVDVRHLRILRALAGEDAGRGLHTYKHNSFYRPALDQLEKTGWIRQVGDEYHLTDRSVEFTREYLKWLQRRWKPESGPTA